jgi:hypothetical protein
MKKSSKTPDSKIVKERPSRPAREGQETHKEASAALSPPRLTAPQSSLQLLPRVIRFKDAPGYLGMDRNRFNTEVRPGLVEIPIGSQGLGFDRLDLDAWFEDYKLRNGRPGPNHTGKEPWDARKYRASSNGASVGISTSKSRASEFAKALEQATCKKRKGI